MGIFRNMHFMTDFYLFVIQILWLNQKDNDESVLWLTLDLLMS